MKMLEKGQKSQKTVKCPVVGCSNKDPIVKVGLIHFSSHDWDFQAHLYTDTEIQRKVAKQRKR